MMATAKPQQRLIAYHVISRLRYSADYLWASAPLSMWLVDALKQTEGCDPIRIAQRVLPEFERQFGNRRW